MPHLIHPTPNNIPRSLLCGAILGIITSCDYNNKYPNYKMAPLTNLQKEGRFMKIGQIVFVQLGKKSVFKLDKHFLYRAEYTMN